MLIVLTSLKAPVKQQTMKVDMTLNIVLSLNAVDFKFYSSPKLAIVYYSQN